MSGWFRKFAVSVSTIVGKPASFFIALVIIILWLVSGPTFGFSDTWQLIINTATTIVTFLMVFLIQNTQNRDSKAIQLKLDELIKTQHGARNTLINLEELPDEEIEALHKEAQKAHARYAKILETRERSKRKRE